MRKLDILHELDIQIHSRLGDYWKANEELRMQYSIIMCTLISEFTGEINSRHNGWKFSFPSTPLILESLANICINFIGFLILSFKWPLLSVHVEFCVCVCVHNFEVKYLANKGRYGVTYYWEPIGKWSGAVEWWQHWWCHVTVTSYSWRHIFQNASSSTVLVGIRPSFNIIICCKVRPNVPHG